jgi:hypothetical protein
MAQESPLQKETLLQRKLIAERVRSLAIVHLTRRPDLNVAEETADVGFDLRVTMLPGEKLGVRQFGVELKGVWRRVTAGHANKVLRPALQHLLRYAPYPYPIVVFFFTMEDDQGWYTWAAEPVVSGEVCELVNHGDASCRPLDAQAVDEVVAAVDRWYDAKYLSYPAVRRPVGKKRK